MLLACASLFPYIMNSEKKVVAIFCILIKLLSLLLLFHQNTFADANSAIVNQKSISKSNKGIFTEGVEQFCMDLPNGHYSYVFDCAKFINCKDGHAFVIECPSNLHFDNESSKCDLPEKAACLISWLDESSSSSSSSSSEEDENCGPSEPPDETTPGTTEIPDFNCNDERCGLFPVEGKPRHFVQCDGKGHLLEHACPAGSTFNEGIGLCDF